MKCLSAVMPIRIKTEKRTIHLIMNLGTVQNVKRILSHQIIIPFVTKKTIY